MSEHTFDQDIHGNIQLPWITLGLVGAATLLYWIAGAAPAGLIYLTDQPFTEIYRIFSGHWVHSDAGHAGLNLTALMILGIIFEPLLQRRMLSVLLLSSVTVSIWTGLLVPDLEAYCGLSGILNSLLVVGCLTLWQHSGQKIYLLFILLAAVKTLIEISGQQAIFSHTSWPAVPEAHLVGMLTGALQYYFFHLRQQSTGFLKHQG